MASDFELAISHPPARGIGRVADNEKAIILTFDRRLTDDEMRAVHDRLRGWHSDDEGAGDPTTNEPLKPRGNNGVVSAEICEAALLLLGDTDVTAAEAAAWTQEERDRAYDWAVRTSLKASDNEDVLVPERPDCVRRRR
jgi:hypothetical protein